MSWNNKVIWTQGMFLQPPHFQQQERHLQHWIETRCNGLVPYSWGISRLEIDQQQLALGKFAITVCQGIFPDGTPFSIPDHHPAPIALDISTEVKDQIVYLSLPLRQINVKEIAWNTDEELSRYKMQEIEVKDLHSPLTQDSIQLQSGALWMHLRLANQHQDAYINIPLAKIKERKTDKAILLDTEFIASCLHVSATPHLIAYIREIQGILQHRGEALAQRLGAPGAGGVAEITDFLLLQIINRYDPLFKHLATVSALHPEQLFRILIQMVGELSTITQANHRPKALPDYIHENLTASFPPVIIALREALSWVSESRAIPIPLEEHKNQVRTGLIHDRQLLKTADFVLAINAQIPTDTLRQFFPQQTTIATVEKLRDLVMAQVRGIRLVALPVAPRQIPFHKGMIYFGLDKNHALWQELEKSGTIAMHFSGEYPGLELEFWAIRG